MIIWKTLAYYFSIVKWYYETQAFQTSYFIHPLKSNLIAIHLQINQLNIKLQKIMSLLVFNTLYIKKKNQ